ncbi:MAG: hypothetical protein ACFFB6_06295 [Promethearchaeota archaeon]
MKKKIEFNYIIGILLFSYGVISAAYSIITVILDLLVLYTAIFLQVKDLLFDIIFILLGFILIRRKKIINFSYHRQ